MIRRLAGFCFAHDVSGRDPRAMPHNEPSPSRPSQQIADAERRQGPRRERDQRLVQRERELDAARRVCQALSQQIQSDTLIEQTLRTALDTVDAEAGSLLLADPKAQQLTFRHVVGDKAELLRGLAIPWDKGLAGAVFSTGKPEIILDAKRDKRHYPNIDELTGFRTRDMIVLPLQQWGRKPIGVLEVMNKRNGRLDQDDVALLVIVSALSTAAIEQARLFEEARLAEVVHRLGDISHDVNNLLTPIAIGRQILQTEIDHIIGSLSEKDAIRVQLSLKLCKEALNTQQSATRRIRDRLQEVSDCVKGLRIQPQLAPCLVSEVIESVVQILGFVADEKGISLRTEGLETLPPVLADRQRLYSAFYNLVNNAIPEVPPGGTVTVRGALSPSGDAMLLSVVDTGRGMPRDIRDSLFSDRAISRKAGGTGLGTRIVRDVVQAHGGRITVESQEGAGTTFLIWLPLQPPGR